MSMPTLKELREKKFMNREELAYKANISMMTIVRLETGKNVPRYKTIKALAKALKVKPEEIEIEKKSESDLK
jgi:transcriptional regulator with XRE-family HTH domain